MNKLVIILILGLNTCFIYSQNINNKYFSLPYNYQDYEEQYNKKNHSYNYNYAKSENEGLMFGIRDASNWSLKSKESFLNAIKNSGTFNFETIYFKSYKAIRAKFYLERKYGFQIGFFTESKSFTITGFSATNDGREKLLQLLENKIKIK